MFDRIRLLILADADAGMLSGIDPAPFRLARGLAGEGFAVEVAAIGVAGTTPTFPPHAECPFYIVHRPRSPLVWKVLGRRAIGRLLRRTLPDCLCAIGPAARIMGLPAARSLGIGARVAWVNDMGFGLTSATLSALRETNCQASQFVVDSFASAYRLSRQEHVDRQRIEVIPHGVDDTVYPARTPESVIDAKHAMGLSRQQPVILMAADFTRYQNHANLLEAAVEIRPIAPDARIVLIGEGTSADQNRLHALIAEHHLEDRVIVSCDHETLPLWLKAADIGVLTSLEESCSEVLLAYMAAGLPAIAANVGGNPELIHHGESGYLINPREPDQLAAFITLLLLSPELAERFGRTARQRVCAEFSTATETRRWADFLRAVTPARV